MILDLLHLHALKVTEVYNVNVCRATTVKFCAKYDTYDKCQQCSTGYYLDKDK